MKVGLITDTHFGIRGDSAQVQTHLEKCLDHFFDVMKSENVETIIHLGDLFDRRKFVNFSTAKFAREKFLERLDVPTYIICGNHDAFFKNTNEVNSLKEMINNSYPLVKFFTNPELITLDGLNIQLVPWVTDDNYDESIQAITSSKSEILMGHLQITGFEMYKGTICDHGTSPNLFARYDKVFSGHFHHKSRIDNITYLGAFSEFDWSDYNDSRGFHIFDTKTRDITEFSSPSHLFKMVVYDDVAGIDGSLEDFSKFSGSYVKIICKSKSNTKKFDMFLSNLETSGAIQVTVLEQSDIISETEETVDQSEDTPTILGKYIDDLTLPVDHGRMKNFMVEIYKEASTFSKD